MPDTPVAEPQRHPYDLLMEARVLRLEEEMRDERAARARLEAAVLRVETILTTALPHLATKADIAELRADMNTNFLAGKADVAELRAAGKADVAELRADMDAKFLAGKADVAELRADMDAKFLAGKADVAELRADMDAKFLAAKADLELKLADKPGKTYMWGILGVLLTAYACGLAALAVLK